MPDHDTATQKVRITAMSQLYAEKWSEVIATGHSKYVLADRIAAGKILHVQNCFAYAPEIAANDEVRIGVRNGGTEVYVRARKAVAKNRGLSAMNEFLVGEGDQVFAYFPNSSDTETIELHIIGELFRLEEWRAREQG